MKKGDKIKLKSKNPRQSDIIIGDYVATEIISGQEVLVIDTKKIAKGMYILSMYDVLKN